MTRACRFNKKKEVPRLAQATTTKQSSQTGVVSFGNRIFRWRKNLLLQRLARALLTIYIATTLSFFLIRLMPSNPVQIYITQLISTFGLSYQEAANMASSLFSIDLDRPMILQYFDYLGNLARGNLGKSLISHGTSVTSMIAEFLPWTLFSVGTSLLISYVLGVLLGMVIAYRRGSMLDHVLTTLASILSSIPNYIVAILVLIFLGVRWKIVPITAMRGSLSPGVVPGFTWEFFGDAFFHAFMPILTYVITTVGRWMLMMKNSTLNTLGEDYVTVAKARGLKNRTITISYVGRNAILPLVTNLAISIGFIIGGAALIEGIFVYKGIGWILLSSINQRDYPVMQGVFLCITVSVVLSNLAAELLYSRLDPRIRVPGGEA
ncbi:MAG: ABC transporter permease [Firmicutes bacterium]|nr:ABC transporter permease [Bacillota bacterium]